MGAALNQVIFLKKVKTQIGPILDPSAAADRRIRRRKFVRR